MLGAGLLPRSLVTVGTLIALLSTVNGNEAAGRPIALADTFSLNQIAQISPAAGDFIAFGDTDHDGRNEVVLSWLDANSFCCFYRILEEQGSNVYFEEYRSSSHLYPFATGDIDGDGRAEIIGQSGYQVQVYESLDAASYPTQLVWSSPNLSNNLGSTTVADTDRDGRMEIIHNIDLGFGNSWLILYENTGDDTYQQVFFERIGYGGEHTIADLDGDGLTEIAFVGRNGRVQIYESPADNTWVRTWADSTELWDSTASEGGRDTDGNGKPELFVMGNSTASGWTTIVYETTGDNQFARIATLSVPEGPSGVPLNRLANLDGQGAEEYVMQGLCCLWVYRASTPGRWDMIQEITDPDGLHNGLYAFDVNRNGRPELFWTTDANFHNTLVLEYPFGVSDTNRAAPSQSARFSILPNPCRVEATLLLEGTAQDAAKLAVYDVAGRLVERRVLLRDAHGQPLWPVRHLSAGIYFLRLEDRSGSSLAVHRATVIR